MKSSRMTVVRFTVECENSQLLDIDRIRLKQYLELFDPGKERSLDNGIDGMKEVVFLTFSGRVPSAEVRLSSQRIAKNEGCNTCMIGSQMGEDPIGCRWESMIIEKRCHERGEREREIEISTNSHWSSDRSAR